MAKKYHGGVSQQSNNRANMPQEVRIGDYPETPCGGKMGYDDTLGGIDAQMHSDNKGNNRKGNVGRW